MAKTSFLEEILFRFDANGLVGSHAVYCDQYTDDMTGEVVAEKLRPAEAIKPASDAVQVVGRTVITHADQVRRLTEETETLKRENAQQRNEINISRARKLLT